MTDMTDILSAIDGVSRNAEHQDQVWQPRLFDLSEETQRREFSALVEGEPHIRLRDTLDAQLSALIEAENPGQSFDDQALRAAVDQRLGDTPAHEYGVWVYYPWAASVAHLLPEAEYRRLRTDRNRNKITAEEQEVLRGLRLGIVGLSVGQATALTLAQEEVGGQYRLADFDELELSNLNRLRAPAFDLGLRKTVLTARGIFEINPFADVRIFSEGIHGGNIEEFLSADGKLDMLFEECDGLDIKIQIREHARRLGIPVLMETSDRGMLDVERFDLEPERAIFHGLVEGLEAASLRGLGTKEKVPIILNILGGEAMSTRMAASLVELETSIKTWPQLASSVALGAALNTDAARRIALGQMQGSGRFYVDFEELIGDAVDGSVAPPQDYTVRACDEAGEVLPVTPHAIATGRARPHVIDPAIADMLLSHARLAPSAGNSQPWTFGFDGKRILCFHDRSRMLFDETVSITAIGSAIENMVLVGRASGIATEVIPFPRAEDPNLVAELRFERCNADPTLHDVSQLISARVTNRKLGVRQPLDSALLGRLRELSEIDGGTLDIIESDADLASTAAVLSAADRVRFFSKELHHDMMKEFRWTPEEVLRTLDGIDVATMEMTSADLAGLRMLRSWPLMKMLMNTGAGRGLERPTRKAIEGASAVARLAVPGYSRESFLQGGRLLQRLWLATTKEGLALQPMAGPIYFFARVEHGDGAGLEARQIRQLEGLRKDYNRIFPHHPNQAEIMVFRLAVAAPPSARALRRPLEFSQR